MLTNETIAALYTAHGARLYGYAVMLLADRGAAEDAVHDTFVQLGRALRRSPDAHVSFGCLAVTLRNTLGACIFSPEAYQRSSFLTTSFSPDHTSSTAQTLTSTKPSGNATSRTVSSVISVGTFDAFFGHDTQTTASGASVCR